MLQKNKQILIDPKILLSISNVEQLLKNRITFQTSLTKTMCQKDTEKIYFSIAILAAVINGHLTCQIKNCLSIKNKFNNNNNRQFSKGK